jgi:hypothetical protein
LCFKLSLYETEMHQTLITFISGNYLQPKRIYLEGASVTLGSDSWSRKNPFWGLPLDGFTLEELLHLAVIIFVSYISHISAP